MNGSHRIEARVLLALMRQDWPQARRLSADAALDPRVFVDLCVACDVPTWIHGVLQTDDRAQWFDAEVLERLGRIRSKIQLDNLLLIARANQATKILLAAGVTPLALKGLDALHRLYPDTDLRTLDDVDLLVREEQLQPALDALAAAGWQLPDPARLTHYIRSSHHLPLQSPPPVPVEFELHWNLVQRGRYTVDPASLFERAVPLEIAGQRLLRLEDHDLVAHLLLHHFSHYFDRRLKWAVDLHAVASSASFDWRQVVERVREWNATAACGMSLAHLARLFPRWIPTDVLQELPVSIWRRAATVGLRSSHPLDMFRGTRNRWVQLYLAAVLLERPGRLPGWLIHRARRDRKPGWNPLDRPSGPGGRQ